MRWLVTACALSVASSAGAGYGDEPPQPGEPGYVAPTDETSAQSAAPLPFDFELAAVADYLASPISGGTNPFGLGVGARFGAGFKGIYLGASFVGYLGSTDVTLSDQSLLIGAELGYGFVLVDSARYHLRVVLRPLVGVGNANVTHTDPALAQAVAPDVVTTASGRTVTGGRASDTVTVNNFYVRPMLALILEHRWFMASIAGDGLLVPGIAYGGADPALWITYGGQLQVGVRF